MSIDHKHTCSRCHGWFDCDRDDCEEQGLCMECEIQVLTAQRDELLAACEAAMAFVDNCESSGRNDAMWLQLRAAIAKAKSDA